MFHKLTMKEGEDSSIWKLLTAQVSTTLYVNPKDDGVCKEGLVRIFSPLGNWHLFNQIAL